MKSNETKDELLKQYDVYTRELSAYDDVLSKINDIRKKKSATKCKLRKFMIKDLGNGQESRLVSPDNNILVISKESTKKLDIKRMKKDGIYEKYVSSTESVKMKEQRTLDIF